MYSDKKHFEPIFLLAEVCMAKIGHIGGKHLT